MTVQNDFWRERGLWRNRSFWPEDVVDGEHTYVYLGRALLLIMQRAFPSDGWAHYLFTEHPPSGQQKRGFIAGLIGKLRSDSLGVPSAEDRERMYLSNQKAVLARKRLEEAKRIVLLAARADLGTYFRLKSGSRMIACPQDWWNAESGSRLMLDCHVNPDDPGDEKRVYRTSAHLFVRNDSLDRLLTRIQDRADPASSPSGKEQKVGEPDIPAPLRQTNSNDSEAKRGRPEKQKTALAIFDDRRKRGLTKQNRGDEANCIIDDWSGSDPPVKKSVSMWIAADHASLIFVKGKLDRESSK